MFLSQKMLAAFSVKRLPAFSVYCLSGICTAFPWLQIHFNITVTFFFRWKIHRSWDPPLSHFLGHLREVLPVIQAWTLCFRGCSAVRSSLKYRVLGVSAAGKLLPPTAYISARDTVSMATESFLFFWWTVSKNRKSTSGVAISAAPRPPACQSQQETIPQF